MVINLNRFFSLFEKTVEPELEEFFYFNGVLSKERISWIRSMIQKYPYPLEVKYIPYGFLEAYSDRTYSIWHEDNCSGGEGYNSIQTGILYGIVARSDSTNDNKFLFLPDLESYETYCEKFSDSIYDIKPFKTVFKVCKK